MPFYKTGNPAPTTLKIIADTCGNGPLNILLECYLLV